jgi:hypothetical protein
LHDYRPRDYARPRSLVSQLPTCHRSRPADVSIEGIQFACASDPIPDIDAASFSLDSIILLLDGRKRFQCDNRALYFRAEELLTIHPTPKAKGVGFLGSSCKACDDEQSHAKHKKLSESFRAKSDLYPGSCPLKSRRGQCEVYPVLRTGPLSPPSSALEGRAKPSYADPGVLIAKTRFI